MPRYTYVPILLAFSMLAAACDVPDTPTEPTTPVVQSRAVTISAVSPTTVMRTGGFIGCPGFTPFLVQFGLVVQGDDTLVVTGFRVRFTDVNGVSTQQITLTAPVPTV